MIYNTLKSVVEPMGHEVFNYGMYSAEENNVDEAVLPANTVPEPIPEPELSAPDAKSALFGNDEPETLTGEII